VDHGLWLAFFLLFLAGGLTPGPAVMLVATSSMRYGFAPSMMAAAGVCAANLVWIALAVSGASVLAHSFPEVFQAVKLAGVAFIFWLAWRTAVHGPVDLGRRPPPPRAGLFARGVGLQLANPNALVYFGGLLPAYIDPDASLATQAAVLAATVTLTEMVGLMIYAGGADWLARRFASPNFARAFYRIAALAMAGSAAYAVWATL
jgi:homoserine/homoserine lactone efflux protein